MATSGATSGRRQRDSDEEDDKGEAEAEVPTKRASYYRQKRPVASESDATSQVAAMPPEESAQRQPLEILLSASEEGDLTTVIDCIENNLDIDCMINKAGHARKVVRVWGPGGDPLVWGHPESLTVYRGDTALRYAAFHGFLAIVEALLAAGALPGLRNDDAKSALTLAELGAKLTLKKYAKKLLPADLPKGDPSERPAVIAALKAALTRQWLVTGCVGRNAVLNGRIAEVVGATPDGQRLSIVKDTAPTPERPWFEKSAAISVYLTPKNLLLLQPPPPPAKAWPPGARFTLSDEGGPVPVEPLVTAAAASGVSKGAVVGAAFDGLADETTGGAIGGEAATSDGGSLVALQAAPSAASEASQSNEHMHKPTDSSPHSSPTRAFLPSTPRTSGRAAASAASTTPQRRSHEEIPPLPSI